ncbi:MAG: hypothetical protein KGJ62_08905 [Armatimonadetes bacterium]|nr:hypothetical protein [Armatimonadota bacterium]MDE2206462.1 hypothetical protein [Armatimonadota bacterium]
MLRVNLLPPYIYDKQKKGKVAVVWGVALALLVVGFVLWLSSVQAALNSATDEDNTAKNYQNTYNDLNTQIAAVQTAIAATQARQTFVANAATYNEAWPDLFSHVRDLISSNVVLYQMQLAGDRQTITFSGFAPSEKALVQWWQQLRTHTDVIQQVSLSLPPHPFVPNGGVAGNNAPLGAQGGAPPGFTIQQKMQAMSGAAGSLMGGGPTQARGTAGGGSQASANTAVLDGRSGLNFTGDIVLVKPFVGGASAPTWPPSGGGGGGGAGGGAFGGGKGAGPSAGMMGLGGSGTTSSSSAGAQ